MFGPSLSTFQYMERAERMCPNHVTQSCFASTQVSIVPISQMASEWEFLGSMCKRPKLPSYSESPKSFFSDSSEDTVSRRSATPSLYFKEPESSTLESFPTFMDNLRPVAGEEELPSHEDVSHCIHHCCHRVCKKTIYLDRKKGITHACAKPDCKAKPSKVDSPTKSLSARRLIHPGITFSDNDHEISVTLPHTLALINHHQRTGELNIHRVLLASPYYKSIKIKARNRHASAAHDAELIIIAGLKTSLSLMLEPLPNNERSITVKELKDTLLACTKWDCVKWIQKWVWTEERSRVNLAMLREELEINEGIRVLIERVEEVVKVFVGGCVRWDKERRAEMAGLRGGMDNVA